jgi:hypothetical protein
MFYFCKKKMENKQLKLPVGIQTFEKLREGIVDFEKIQILREKATASSDKTVRKLLSELEQHLKVFVSEKIFDETKITGDVNKGKTLLNQLSEQLTK